MTNIIGVKILAEYAMSLDDVDGQTWMTEQLYGAARGGLIDDYNVLTTLTDATGVQLSVFIIDKTFGFSFSEDQTSEQAMHSAANLLSDLFHDTAATVRWLAPLEA